MAAPIPTATGEILSNFETLHASIDGTTWRDISGDSNQVSPLTSSKTTETANFKASNHREVKMTSTTGSDQLTTDVSFIYSRNNDSSYRWLRNAYLNDLPLYFRRCPGGAGTEGAEWFGTSNDGTAYAPGEISNFQFLSEHTTGSTTFYMASMTITYSALFIEDAA